MENQTTETKKKKPLLPIAAAVVGGAAVVYVGLCAAGNSGETFRRNTIIDGVSIAGMTQEEAEKNLSGWFDTELDELDGKNVGSIELIPDIEGYDGSFTLTTDDILSWNFGEVLQQVYQEQRGGSFLTQGIKLVTGGKEYSVIPYVEDGEGLQKNLQDCGILDLDTSVDASYEIMDDSILITKGKNGYKVDADALTAAIVANTAEGNYDPITCPVIATEGSTLELQSIYDEVYQEVSEATIKVADDLTWTIVDSVEGVSFDLDAAASALDAAEDGSQVTVALTRTEPAISTDQLEECLFRDVLGQYTTNVSGTSARRSNVKLAASKCNGYILLPGEEFDYNAVVGQRTAAAGFQEAAAYSNGETVQELGGGVCQVSSTLYCACMYANLKITSRRNHTYVSSYVPIGMDATVSWGGPEYKFVNDTDYPIRLVSSYENDRVSFTIYGTDVNHYTVKITSETLSTQSPTVQKVEDPTLEEGKSYTVSTGHTGYTVQTYRHVYDADGNLVSESKEATSVYSPSNTIVHVGTKVVETEKTDADAGTDTGTDAATDAGAETGNDDGGAAGENDQAAEAE